jgi:FkbM family methyltransferase
MTEHGFARGLACEPDPNNFRMLRMNILVNGLDDRVDARQVALSDAEGVIGLALSQTNWGDHRVVVPGGTALAERETIEVERVPVDQLLERRGTAPSDIGLVWIDAQGHEAEILAGAESVLAAGVPIVFELWMKTLDANGSIDRLHEIVEATSSLVYDLRTVEEGAGAQARPAGAIRELTDCYRESGKITDILLARPRP